MHYQISRNGQQYGPYTLEDIQRYVATGNILPTDMAKNDEMTDWVPVSQLLPPTSTAAPSDPFGNPSYANPASMPVYGQPAAPAQAFPYPDPPNLNWGLVLLFAFLTCGLFMLIWNLVIAAWLKRVQPNANALFFYLGVVGLALVGFVVGGVASTHMMVRPQSNPSFAMLGPMLGLRAFLWFAMWVVKLIARFSQSASLEEHFNGPEPVGLSLSGVMTFFFGGLYFQYHINRIVERKQLARFNSGRAF